MLNNIINTAGEIPEHKKFKAKKLAKQGYLASALRSLRQNKQVNYEDPNIQQQLKALHPGPYNDINDDTQSGWPNMDTSIIEGKSKSSKLAAMIGKEEISKHINQLPKDKSPGPSKWTNDLIKFAFHRSANFQRLIYHIINELKIGRFPIPNMVNAATLIGIPKGNNDEQSKKVRPIAMGDALLKVCVKIIFDALNQKWEVNHENTDRQFGTHLALSKEQCGVGTSGGTELIPFVIDQYYKNGQLDAVVTLDYTSAFNSISRHHIARTVAMKRPDLLPLFLVLYSQPTILIPPKGEILYSKEGVRQGCVLGSYLFALASDDTLQIERNLAERLGGQVLAYQDDHIFIFHKEKPLNANITKTQLINLIIEETRDETLKTKLQLNESKCHIYRPGKGVDNQENIQTHKMDDGIVIVGTPIGSPEYKKKIVKEKLQEARVMMRVINKLDDTQIAFHLMRTCLAPTVSFLLRNLDENKDLFKQWDQDIMESILKMVLKNDVSKEEMINDIPMYMIRDLISLRQTSGGLGINLARHIHKNARLASLINSLKTVVERKISCSISRQDFNFISINKIILEQAGFNMDDNKSIFDQDYSDKSVKSLQHRLTKLTYSNMKQLIRVNLPKRHRHAFEDHQGKGNNVLIATLPTIQNFIIESDLFKEVLGQRLLIAQSMQGKTCQFCNIGTEQNPMNSNHSNSCKSVGWSATRHGVLKDVFKLALNAFKIKYQENEPIVAKFINEHQQWQEIKADIICGQNQIADFAIIQTKADNKKISRTLDEAFTRKKNWYMQISLNRLNPRLVDIENNISACQFRNSIYPIIFASMGMIEDKSFKIIKSIFNFKQLDEKGKANFYFWMKRMSFTVARSTIQGAMEWNNREQAAREEENL